MVRMILSSIPRVARASSIPHTEFMLIDGMGHDLPPALHGTVAEAIDQIARRATESMALE
jgi:hypothetical protein